MRGQTIDFPIVGSRIHWKSIALLRWDRYSTRGRRLPFPTALVADSQRSLPGRLFTLAHAQIAKGATSFPPLTDPVFAWNIFFGGA
jgi:hypothetical protein